ncbi:hypothetical protein B1J92_I05742g [Nakaseomyces glabratus]|nr:hypothetical protein B1J91_I05742g [Nakaseomyces glabratus]OXB47737.1 hypothetical protein B1J92_I05742g [Nakaseomyces glabratus]
MTAPRLISKYRIPIHRISENMVLNNDGLKEIGTLLVSASDREPEVKLEKTKDNSSSDITTPPAEFIPSIFFSLHKIRKDPNNVSSQLETSTGFIRHRIKRCKALLQENEEVRNLLANSIEEWENIIADKEQQLRVKAKVLRDLDARIEKITN